MWCGGYLKHVRSPVLRRDCSQGEGTSWQTMSVTNPINEISPIFKKKTKQKQNTKFSFLLTWGLAQWVYKALTLAPGAPLPPTSHGHPSPVSCRSHRTPFPQASACMQQTSWPSHSCMTYRSCKCPSPWLQPDLCVTGLKRGKVLCAFLHLWGLSWTNPNNVFLPLWPAWRLTFQL